LVILVASDHGEGFYEHGTWAHRNSLHEELLHVPLAVRAPALPAGDVDALVSLESVPATLLVLAGFAPPPETVRHHRELVPAPGRSAPCAASLQFAGTRARSLILDGKKWIEVSRGERKVTQLFDVSRDPLELNSLPTSGDAVARRMRAEAGRLFDFHERLSILSNDRADMSDLEETLRGLGYVR
jgi:arylsulfatase A-like enzyme